MTWNHRVMRVDYPLRATSGTETQFEIHEVHYSADGLPRAYTKDAVGAAADDLAGLEWTLKAMLAALEKPVLTPADFPDGGKSCPTS
jgi:hypothetical protein